MKILMVCLGNICRSPMAEGILRDKLNRKGMNWEVDSCGTSNYHIGESPDRRATQTARQYGIDITDLRARQFQKSDFDDFDLILAMDAANYRDIVRQASGEEQKSKVKLFLEYLYPNENRGVPDPYFEGGFDQVFHMIDGTCDALINYHSS